MVYLHRAGVSSSSFGPHQSDLLPPSLILDNSTRHYFLTFPSKETLIWVALLQSISKNCAMEAASHHGLGGLEPVR